MSDRRSNAAVLVAILLLPVGYSGAYYALARPSNRMARNTDNELMYEPDYRLGGAVARRVFYPWHVLDRNLRPGAWLAPPPPELHPTW